MSEVSENKPQEVNEITTKTKPVAEEAVENSNADANNANNNAAGGKDSPLKPPPVVESSPTATDSKKSPIKRTPSKRMSFIERAQKESEELVKNMGGSLELEGGRRTRSSTRGTPSRSPVVVQASTPPPAKKAKTSPSSGGGTPNSRARAGGSRGRKLETTPTSTECDGGENTPEQEKQNPQAVKPSKEKSPEKEVKNKEKETADVTDSTKPVKEVPQVESKPEKPKDGAVAAAAAAADITSNKETIPGSKENTKIKNPEDSKSEIIDTSSEPTLAKKPIINVNDTAPKETTESEKDVVDDKVDDVAQPASSTTTNSLEESSASAEAKIATSVEAKSESSEEKPEPMEVDSNSNSKSSVTAVLTANEQEKMDVDQGDGSNNSPRDVEIAEIPQPEASDNDKQNSNAAADAIREKDANTIVANNIGSAAEDVPNATELPSRKSIEAVEEPIENAKVTLNNSEHKLENAADLPPATNTAPTTTTPVSSEAAAAN